jgi:putative SOS response-associated peptidase YedK
MCGRFVTALEPDKLGRWQDRYDPAFFTIVPPSFNVPPTAQVPVWLPGRTAAMHWGLIPHWAKEPKMTFATFNARVEGFRDKPTFRDAWRAGRRCLIPARGYFEWRDEPGGKQPYFVHRNDREPLVFAGLWERWTHADQELLSCTIITGPAHGRLQELHHRMPCCIEAQAAEPWLHGSHADADAVLATTNPEPLTYYRVSRAVGNVRNNSPQLLEAI